jgi:chromosomal replication initiation ATPase DnaA
MKTEDLLNEIEDETGITLDQIKSPSRKEELVFARRIITWYMVKEGYTDSQIAGFINRHRTTVIWMCNTHESEYVHNPKFRHMFDIFMMPF